MSILKWFASLVFASTVPTCLLSESNCPGNVASLPYRLVNRYEIVAAVSINHTGPYSFLIDTGTQVSMVDPSLAAQLHLSGQGEAVVANTGSNASASFARIDLMEAGSHAVTGQDVLVYDLGNLEADGLDIRGVLGEDFLEHFDMLIDNAHDQLCLDDSGTLRAELKGQHIPLLAPAPAAEGTLPRSLIVSARLSDGMRPVRLKLDSGANISFLYNTSSYMALGAFRGASLQGGAGSRRTYTALPPQTMKIGSVEVAHVAFVTQAGIEKDSRTSDFDGLLTLGLFRRVFIAHADHFAIFDPK